MPAFRVVVFQILIASDPAKYHGLGEEELLRPDRKVYMGRNERDKSDTGQPMQYVHPAPSHVAKKVRITSKEGCLHALHHEKPRPDCRESRQHNHQMIQLVLKRIFCELSRCRSGLPQRAFESSRSVLHVLFVRPD